MFDTVFLYCSGYKNSVSLTKLNKLKKSYDQKGGKKLDLYHYFNIFDHNFFLFGKL
jgi:hypothetical protein